jgi:hypothetical protein
LLLFVEPTFGPIGELCRFIPSSWYEVIGKVTERHLCTGTGVKTIRKWKEVTSYVERYMAKCEVFPARLQTGRIWGIWTEGLLPVRWETAQVNLTEAFRIEEYTGSWRREKVAAPYAA